MITCRGQILRAALGVEASTRLDKQLFLNTCKIKHTLWHAPSNTAASDWHIRWCDGTMKVIRASSGCRRIGHLEWTNPSLTLLSDKMTTYATS